MIFFQWCYFVLIRATLRVQRDRNVAQMRADTAAVLRIKAKIRQLQNEMTEDIQQQGNIQVRIKIIVHIPPIMAFFFTLGHSKKRSPGI